ncbi:MAG: helix-turn-helix domain-containing protein [Dysgonamonadaceae bacterium]|jgi:DNA-binding XRE family transcriptional regulator|nr:helix-turn-helix domain-containing protein [Dysgonamonadaceae bacterium]
MIQLDPAKLAKLKTAEQLFTERYGEQGAPARVAFEERALNWYYSEILKERRKELKITQKQLAEKIGKNREYIALLEKGKTDMQLSTFITISQTLGLKFVLM